MVFFMIAMNQKMAIFVLGLALAITAALAIAPVASELAYACNGAVRVEPEPRVPLPQLSLVYRASAQPPLLASNPSFLFILIIVNL